MQLDNLAKYSNPIDELGEFSKNKMEALTLPNQKNEKWKYSDLAKFIPDFELINEVKSDYQFQTIKGFKNINFMNGKLHSTDVEIRELNSDNKKQIEQIKRANTKLLSDEWLMHLIEAHGENQYYLELSTTEQVLINHHYSGDQAKHIGFHLHILAKSNSFTQILENHTTDESANNFTNYANSIVLEKNSQLHLTQLQNLNHKSSIVNNLRSSVDRDATFKNITANIGAIFSRNNVSSVLIGENADTTLSGLYNLRENQHHDTNSYIGHIAPHSFSHQLYKGVMKDKSRGVFTGLIKVEKDAQLIESEQLNKNLLLSKGAHANSRPQLEIFADDVKCAHGSTTGQMSEDELFYFNARGIPSDRARKILARAFSNDVLLKIDNHEIRNFCKDIIIENREDI